MHCSACGAELLLNAAFCVKCGARILPQWSEEGAEEHTITVSRPTMRMAAGPLAPPHREEQVPGGAPPIAGTVEDQETGAIPVAAIALVSTWYLLLPDGVRVDAVLPLVLGRKPSRQGRPEWAQLVTVPDPEGTVSRSHALLEPVGGTLRLTNLSTKNTIPVAWPDGVRYNIVPGEQLVVATMCALKLGNVPVLLQRA